MYRNKFYLQTSENRGQIHAGLISTASNAKYDKLTVSVAYATRIGCEILVKGLQSALPNWIDIEKRWLISFDFGHTDPNALDYLSKLPNSTVRIPNADLALKSKLRPPIRFHVKIYLFECKTNPDKIAILSGSCNLTKGGLYTNTEQATALVLSPPMSKADNQMKKDIIRRRDAIKQLFSSSKTLNKGMLSKYRLLWRPKYLPRTERQSPKKILDSNPSIDMDKAIALSNASAFWIKITPKVVKNLGVGKPGNQIDMQRGARVFFGYDVANVPPNTMLGPVKIKYKGITSDYSIRFGNNSMDKINLPVLQAPKTYANQTLLFKRMRDDVFNLYIGNPKQVQQWRNKSQQQNTLFYMKSGREYGSF